MAHAFAATADRRAHLTDPALYRAFYERDQDMGTVREMPENEPRLRWVLSHIGPHDDVIDIGCHKGEMTRHLWAATDGQVYGVDISANAIRHAAVLPGVPNDAFRVGDAADLKFGADIFDVAILCEILEHVPDPAAVIAAAERVVKPGGLVIVSTPCNAIAIDRWEAQTRDRAIGMALDMHVREFDPAIELAGKPDLEVTRGNQEGVRPGFLGIDQWLAVYRVRKE